LLCTDIGRYHVHDWDAIVAGYVHQPLDLEDELPMNPYIDARPEVPGAVTYLREREAKSMTSH
jgi:hypothetical protein